MATESITLRLKSAGAFDGTSPITATRDDATVTQQRIYEFNLSGANGIVNADMLGLFAPVSMKLVGVAYSSWSPENKARVLAPDGSFRQEITLKPAMQFVVMYPGDRLGLLTEDARLEVTLVVNEVNEAEAVQWARGHEPFAMPSRFRIVRRTGVPFTPNLASAWAPDFGYEVFAGILTVDDDGSGMIQASTLCLYPRWQGCYVSIRYAGSNGNGRLHIVDNTTRKSWIAESGLTDVKWSRVQYIGHDDGIALEASPAAPGQTLACDIEVSLVHPADRLSRRFGGGL